jgi:hypothetical protein
MSRKLIVAVCVVALDLVRVHECSRSGPRMQGCGDPASVRLTPCRGADGGLPGDDGRCWGRR